MAKSLTQLKTQPLKIIFPDFPSVSDTMQIILDNLLTLLPIIQIMQL